MGVLQGSDKTPRYCETTPDVWLVAVKVFRYKQQTKKYSSLREN